MSNTTIKTIKVAKTDDYYGFENILKTKSQFKMVIGMRSNGKSYAGLAHALKRYWEDGSQLAYIRRWDEDIKTKSGTKIMSDLVNDGIIEKVTGGEYTTCVYKGYAWYLANYDEKMKTFVTQPQPFAFALSLNNWEHSKSNQFPNCNTIIFEEFITRGAYLADEFVIFMNVVSTIIRNRETSEIFLLGNTVNKYCPYFNEMGLTNIRKQKQGTIDVYQYGTTGLKVAVEYCHPLDPSKRKSSVLFAFDNPKLKMITQGEWEIAMFPHCPVKYKFKDILFNYFIEFDGDLFQCEIVSTYQDGCEHYFTFIHRKTTPIKNDNTDILYSDRASSSKPNVRRNLLRKTDNIDMKLVEFFVREKVFYQDNEVGNTIANYINWCKQSRT